MKKIALLAMGIAAFVCACALITQYPIYLRYTPEGVGLQANAQPKEKVVTVTTFMDNRGVANHEILGTWVDNKETIVPFVSSKGTPAASVTRAFATYLSQQGYSVREEPRSWDLKPESIRPGWGDLVIGGSIEELSVNAMAEGVKITYNYKLNLIVVVADATEQKNKYKETIEFSSSYEKAMFSPEAAEEKINKMLAEAVEKALVDIEKKK